MIDNTNFLTELKRLIGENQTNSVLRELESKIKPNSPQLNELILIKNRFQKIQKQSIIGLLSNEEFLREETKLNYDIIIFIDTLYSYDFDYNVSIDILDFFEVIEDNINVFRYESEIILSTSSSRKDISNINYEVMKINITESGNFEISIVEKIVDTFEHYSYDRLIWGWGAFGNQDSKRTETDKYKRRNCYTIRGNFEDIYQIEYIENGRNKNTYKEDICNILRFKCYKREKKINLIFESKNESPFRDGKSERTTETTEALCDSFDLYLDKNNNMGLRLKNTFTLIASYFSKKN